MGILRPVRMQRIGLLGLKDDRETVLSALHDLRVAQIETLPGEALAQLIPERADQVQRRIADESLRFRGLLAALPLGPDGPRQRFASPGEIFRAAAKIPIDGEVGALKSEDDRLLTEERALAERLELADKLAFFPGRLEDLRARSLLTFYGETEPDALAAVQGAVPSTADPVFLTGPGPDETVRFLLVVRPSGAEALARSAQTQGIRLTALPALEGTVAQESARVTARRAEVTARRTEIAARLAAISQQWYGIVAAIDEALAVENRKVEALQRLGAGRVTFALEAWVPERDVDRLRRALAGLVGGRAYLYPIPTSEEPPTMMDNPPGIRRFEFFVRFYSLPLATEFDPTFVFAIVFPIFFGFMLGDWGYGLVILLISLWMIAGFPGARYLPKGGRNFVKLIMGPKGMQQLAYALIPGCLLAIGLGLFLDEFFGYHLLAALVGYHAPIDPVGNIGKLLLFAGFVGLGMVTLGFLFGLLREYFRRHYRGAAGKFGGILFAWGIAFVGLSLIYGTDSFSHLNFVAALGLTIGGVVLMIAMEGVMTGGMGMLEVISHVLSYTRLVGILLASVILAFVINLVGAGLVKGVSLGGVPLLGVVLGLLILVGGQAFNVILGVFEPGIQGARLIFVEYFSKFYSGNGKPFRPFGAKRVRTVSTLEAAPAPLPNP